MKPSKISDFFKPKNTVVDREEDSDDYTVKQNKKADIIIRIFSILAAIIIWIYAVSTDGAIKTIDYKFTSADIVLENAEILSERTLKVIIEETDITVTVKGRKLSAGDAARNKIKVYVDYVDVAGINSVGETVLKLNVKVPLGVTLDSFSPEYVKADVTLGSSLNLPAESSMDSNG